LVRRNVSQHLCRCNSELQLYGFARTGDGDRGAIVLPSSSGAVNSPHTDGRLRVIARAVSL
jgi:hypothetical protein